jgi:PKD repeat protein/type 1 glutamine amidotransferase
LLVAGLALTAPATAPAKPAVDHAVSRSAKPNTKLRSVGTPPRTAAPGSAFTLRGKLVNTSRSTQRPRLTITLRRTRTSAPHKLATATLRRVKKGRTLSYRVRVKLPAQLAEGRYHVRTCAGSVCRFSARRLIVRKRPTAPPPATPRPATPPGTPAPAFDFDVLVFTKGAADDAAVAAIRDIGSRKHFGVAVTDDASAFTEDNLKRYRAVVFANTSGDVLTDAQQTAFQAYFTDGGGFLGIGRAITTEPGWTFLSDVLGTRASGEPAALDEATIKVADRGHAAGRDLQPYWTHADRYYNFAADVRGRSHVLATVDEKTYAGGAMGADHPIAWCKNYKGGRSFYTGVGGAPESYADPSTSDHLAGAIAWTAGVADPVHSDCGATVLANYQQTKISAPPNLNEPIGFDVLPDGRVIQTSRGGQIRLHDPERKKEIVLATLPVYTNSEDGLYGPAIDNDFATNHWVYLYYAPPTVRIKKCDGTTADVTTPAGSAPTVAAEPCVWQDTWAGYFKLSRFKFVDGASPSLDLGSEQKILQVANDRGACCHVAGDIDFDKHNTLWMVTGDDTPSGGGNSGGFSPHNDQKTDEIQTVRVNNATGGTFTLTFDGQTTAPIAYDANAAAVRTALEGLSIVAPGDVSVTGGPVNTANVTVQFDGAYAERDLPTLTGDSPAVAIATPQEGGWYNAPFVDARRSAQNTNDLRGKILRIKVAADGSYTVPKGNLFAPGTAKTRPEIYAMGFRNPFRIQVDENDVAYVTDYSPDSAVPENFRGPAGTGRVEIVRKRSNYGWPLCVAPNLPYYRWNFNTSRPLDATPRPHGCDNPARGPQNSSRWNDGLEYAPAISRPDLWYSYRDNANPPLGTPCLASYDGSNGTCPQLFPELYTNGVAPHGAVKYHYDPDNPSTTKFPPYYDNSVFLGEFNLDTLREVRLDADNRIFKINSLLDCGDTSANRDLLPFECDAPMDMQFGPDGAFYLLSYGDGFFNQNPDAGLYKFEYVGGKRAPQAAIGATPTDGKAPLTVHFSSEGSRDPDPGDSIAFAWDFDDDGTVDSIDPNPTHVYAANGVYTAKLTVTDSSDKSDSKSTVITVGNTAPVITISAPAEGGFFDWGQRIAYTVSVTDAEDGAGDCSKVDVTFVLLHDTHGHGEQNVTGCSGTLQTLAEDASHGGQLAGGISVSYTDKGAGGQPPLTTVTQTVVQAKRHEAELMTERSGTSAATSYFGTPTYASSLDPGDWLAVNRKVDLRNMTSISVDVAACGTTVGAPAGVLELRLDSPAGALVKSFDVKVTDAGQYCSFVPTLQTLTVNVTDPGGGHQLYLVPKAAAGGPNRDLFYVNWVQFNGAGIGS